MKQIGTRENATVHSGALLLLRADLSNFFPSISSEKLVEGFKKLGLNQNIIKILIGFLTLDKCLPLGFPASPMLANIVCKELDKKISDLALKYECKYTRYADDISISGNTTLPTKEELAEIICKENFRLCESKFRITKIGQAHYVTGLSISDNEMPHAPKSLKKKLRQQLYYCKKFGIKNHLIKTTGEDLYTTEGSISQAMQSGINRIHGMICYISHIEKKPILLHEWRDLLARDKCTINYTSYHKLISEKLLCRYNHILAPLTNLADNTKEQVPKNIVFYVDETEICIKNTNKTYLAIAFTAIESDKVKDIAIDIKKMLDKYIINPYTGSKKDNLKKINYILTMQIMI